MQKQTKKVAIMTWYTYRNYGTALQASALYHKIEELGYAPTFLCYPPKGHLTESEKLTPSFLFKKVVEKIRQHGNGIYRSDKRDELFSDFLRTRTTETSPCRTYPELYQMNDEYQAFVCGSDQIWSPLCYDDKYFLSFVEESRKMVAYAPSIGSCEIRNPLVKEKMAALLARFHHLSVREEQGAELIRGLTGQQAEVVLDPTLLLDAQEWLRFADAGTAPALPEKPYILCYFLGDSEKYKRYVGALSKKMNLPVYTIPVTQRQKEEKQALPFEVGPREFVSLIRHAGYVCTDSFHGMAFAINNRVPFCVFKRFSDRDPKNQNSRVLHLLRILRLEDRLVDPAKREESQISTSCDFTEAHARLAELRKTSMSFLAASLADATDTPACRETTKPYKITELCCGCGACAAVCPKSAITISCDEEGFEQYAIDREACVRCGICKSVCPMAQVTAQDLHSASALWAVKSRSDSVLKASSSGGVGYELAKLCQQEGRSVFGCVYEPETNSAKHIVIYPHDTEGLARLQGSKYLQSHSADAMKELLRSDATDTPVFFGTPCQTAAVDKLLRKQGRREKALLVDLICHGVPSGFLWEKYLTSVDKTHGTGKHPAVLFRSKEAAWRNLRIHVSGNGHDYRNDEHKDDFYAFFRRGLCYMRACSECPYRERSAADLRIGDYWGPRFEGDKQGVSMVIANTAQGKAAIASLAENGVCRTEEQSLEEYWTVQYPYNRPMPLIREQLIRDLKDSRVSLHDLRKHYCQYDDRKEKLAKLWQGVKKQLRRG